MAKRTAMVVIAGPKGTKRHAARGTTRDIINRAPSSASSITIYKPTMRKVLQEQSFRRTSGPAGSVCFLGPSSKKPVCIKLNAPQIGVKPHKAPKARKGAESPYAAQQRKLKAQAARLKAARAQLAANRAAVNGGFDPSRIFGSIEVR